MVAAEWNNEKWRSNKNIIRGIDEINMSVSVKTATDSANKTTKIVGRNLETLDISFKTAIGVGGNPVEEQKKLQKQCGKSAPFYCGTEQLGDNDFILVSAEMSEGLLTAKGEITTAAFSLKFLEDGKEQEKNGTSKSEEKKENITIMYEGSNIARKISIKSILYTQYASNHADVLELQFNDTGKNWDRWDGGKMSGTEISVEAFGVKTGKMFVHSCSPRNGVFELRALSVPPDYNSTATKSWEKISLEELAKEIASNHGLSCKTYSTNNVKRKYVAQNNQGDFEFLSARCLLEGAAFVVYDGVLNLYDEKSLEADKEGVQIDIDDEKFTEAEPIQSKEKAIGEYTVKNGRFSGKATDENATQKKTEVIDEALEDDAGAEKIAIAKLRASNKNINCIEITTDLQKGISAGSVIGVKTEKRPNWNCSAFVYKVRHNLMKNKTKIWARKPLCY